MQSKEGNVTADQKKIFVRTSGFMIVPIVKNWVATWQTYEGTFLLVEERDHAHYVQHDFA